jgi:hypothetical protein
VPVGLFLQALSGVNYFSAGNTQTADNWQEQPTAPKMARDRDGDDD